MEKVYHSALEKHEDSILNEGIKRNINEINIDVSSDETFYFIPDSVPLDDAHSYASTLASKVLASERPPDYPRHFSGIFFFTSKGDLDDLNRRSNFEISTEAFQGHYPIVQTPYEVASELFFDTMRTMEIGNKVKKEVLQNRAEKYWKKSSKVHNKQDIEPHMELFTSQGKIPVKYIRRIP